MNGAVFDRLAEGLTHVAAALALRLVPGGRHPDFGTHDRVLSPGPGACLAAGSGVRDLAGHSLVAGVSGEEPGGHCLSRGRRPRRGSAAARSGWTFGRVRDLGPMQKILSPGGRAT